MSYSVKVLADSVHYLNTDKGERLTTFELVFPRFILAEFNTHRRLSRNSASSRAIPVSKQIRKILEDPFVPENFGKNMRGMQASTWLSGKEHSEAVRIFMLSRNYQIASAAALILGQERVQEYIENPDLLNFNEGKVKLLKEIEIYEEALKNKKTDGYLNVHKQTANRLLEPYAWHTVVVTGDEFENFFALRANKEAQPEIQKIAVMALEAYRSSKPVELKENDWHLPLIQDDEVGMINAGNIDEWKKVSAGRCARTSYETHHGKRDLEADIKLFEQLTNSGHMSPLEHVATPYREGSDLDYRGNFLSWNQWRKYFRNEDNFMEILKETAPELLP